MQESVERESMEFDVVVVGGGPAGSGDRVPLAQLANATARRFPSSWSRKVRKLAPTSCLATYSIRAASTNCFRTGKVRRAVADAGKGDVIHYLTSARRACACPEFPVPAPMHNQGNYIISLGSCASGLAKRPRHWDSTCFQGFAASETLFDNEGRVRGVATSDMGVGKDGQRKASYQAGYELLGKYTVFAEGCRGNLGEQLIDKFDLARRCGSPALRHRPQGSLGN